MISVVITLCQLHPRMLSNGFQKRRLKCERILADVGKLLEYEIGPDGKSRQSERGEALRHPFTGVALAMECGVPDAVCHIIAAHAAEGDLVKRTTEAFIVHHADFMAFLPFKNPKNVKVK